MSDDDYSDSNSETLPNGVEVVNKTVNPSDKHSNHSNTMNQSVHPTIHTPSNHTHSGVPTSDSIDLTDSIDLNEVDHQLDPSNPPDDFNSSFDPGDDPVHEDVESKYGDEQNNHPIVAPSNAPVSREVRKLQELLTPINSKYTQPTIAPNNAPPTLALGEQYAAINQSPPIQTITTQLICIMLLII